MRRIGILIGVVLVSASFAIGADAEEWIDKDVFGTTVYLMFESPPRIERFDMNALTFNPTPIALPATPTAVAVDATGLYVAANQVVSRYELDGTNPTHRVNAPAPIDSLLLMDGLLIVQYLGDQFISTDKLTGTIIALADYHDGMIGLSVDPASRRVFGSKDGGSPRDIIVFSMNVDGTFGVQRDSLFHGELRTGLATFVNPSGGYVIDTSGTVYTMDLELAGSLAAQITDAVFASERIVVLRGDEIATYDSQFLEDGIRGLDVPVRALALNGQHVHGFYPVDTAPGAASILVALNAIEPPPLHEEIDPNGHGYTPNAVLTASGLVYLLSAVDGLIFVWSPVAQEYVDVIPLSGSPDLMVYASGNNSLYLGHESGKITQVDLGAPLQDHPLVNTPNVLTGMSGTDDTLFVMNGNDAAASRFQYMYDAAGSVIDSSSNTVHFSFEYVWEPVFRRIYCLGDNVSPSDLAFISVLEDGTFGITIDSPYHGDFPFFHPVRISPDGTRILVGSGRIFDDQLNVVNFITETPVDAAWFDGDLHTVRPEGTLQSVVRRWAGPNYEPGPTVTVEGAPIALFALAEGLLVITEVNGAPAFSLLDASLTEIPPQESTGGGGGGGGSGCFIATAAFGTPIGKELDSLRAFRDRVLLTQAIGGAFADAYYRSSPPIADAVARHPWLRPPVRIAIVFALGFADIVGSPVPIIGLTLLAGVLVLATKRKRIGSVRR